MTPLQQQNNNVLNALNEGRLQGRVEALSEIIDLFTTYNTTSFEAMLVKVYNNAKHDYEKWFE
jgi:hypothetical protein